MTSKRDRIAKQLSRELGIPLMRARRIIDSEMRNQDDPPFRETGISWSPGTWISSAQSRAWYNFSGNSMSDAGSLLISGKTGSGKTVAIQTMLNQLTRRYEPTDLEIWCVDPYDSLDRHSLRDTQKTIFGMDSQKPEEFHQSAFDLIDRFTAKMEARQNFFEHHAKNPESIAEARSVGYRDGYADLVSPYQILVIDSYQTLFGDFNYPIALMELQDARDRAVRSLTTIATQGKNAGFFVVISTQLIYARTLPPLLFDNMQKIAFSMNAEQEALILGGKAGMESRRATGEGYMIHDSSEFGPEYKLLRVDNSMSSIPQ